MLVSFGRMIKFSRKEMNLSRSEFGKRIGKSEKFVEDMEETLLSAPSKAIVKRIAEVVDLHFEMLWQIAGAERFFKFMESEGMNPFNTVLLKKEISLDQRVWIHRKPEVLDCPPYSDLVLFDGRKLGEWLRYYMAMAENDLGKPPFVLTAREDN